MPMRSKLATLPQKRGVFPIHPVPITPLTTHRVQRLGKGIQSRFSVAAYEGGKMTSATRQEVKTTLATSVTTLVMMTTLPHK